MDYLQGIRLRESTHMEDREQAESGLKVRAAGIFEREQFESVWRIDLPIYRPPR